MQQLADNENGTAIYIHFAHGHKQPILQHNKQQVWATKFVKIPAIYIEKPKGGMFFFFWSFSLSLL